MPGFEVRPLNLNCHAIDAGGTVATVSAQGVIDWLLKSPLQSGSQVQEVRKETHLSYVQGLQIHLFHLVPRTQLQSLSFEPSATGQLTITARCESPDGVFGSLTIATLQSNREATRYEWMMETVLTNRSDQAVALNGLEYNNVYPSLAGRCMLFAPWKQYSATLMADRSGQVWAFPHQHMMHYTTKINQLQFAVGSWAGFFNEPWGSPVVEVLESSVEPDWGICDMYYDLHCMARVGRELAPGEALRFRYRIAYVSGEEGGRRLHAAIPIPVTEADQTAHDYPRFELGLNTFTERNQIDRCDDASGFRPRPPGRVWDREVGHRLKGSLRLVNPVAERNVWGAEPPTQIPNEHTLNISAMVKTEAVTGKGIYLEVRYHTYHWRPEPHVEWVQDLCSEAVNGTSSGWVRIQVPPLTVPEEHFDYLVWLNVVLEGQGTAWVTEVEVGLDPVLQPQPQLQEGSGSVVESVAGGGVAGALS